MKTTKRVLAIVIAALMLALMIPFAVSAATTPDVTFTLHYTMPDTEKAGDFVWTVYKLAELDLDDGTYTTVSGLDSSIVNAIKDSTTTSSAAVLTACDNYSKNHTTGFGTSTGKTLSSGSDDLVCTLPAGIYYIKATTPDNATKKNNSIVALPYFDGTEWQSTLPRSTATSGTSNVIDLGTKFSTNPVKLTKKVKDTTKTTTSWVDATTQSIGQDVQFRTFVTTVGSDAQKINGYKVVDTMETGLKFKQVDSVKFFAEETSTTGSTVDSTAYSVTDTSDTGFTVLFDADYLQGKDSKDPTAFYTNKYIEILYTCTITKDATCGSNTNDNTAQLYYIPNGQTSFIDGPDDTAVVYTYEIEAFKFDATTGTNKTPIAAEAEFKIFATRTDAENGENALATATTSGSTGKGTFQTTVGGNKVNYKFASGIYYVKETKAPAHFNINTSIITVEIGADSTTATFTASIGDTPARLPETGGEGTMMFTIIGGSLILLAGALFVVVMKKRASK